MLEEDRKKFEAYDKHTKELVESMKVLKKADEFNLDRNEEFAK